MHPDAALAWVAQRAPASVEVDLDEQGDLVVFTRRDMFHLDADALNDRLAAWAFRELRAKLPAATAFVSFRHASPSNYDEAELDMQEFWLGLQPTLRLDLTRPPTQAELAAVVACVPKLLELIEAEGRPAGWRRVDEGNVE